MIRALATLLLGGALLAALLAVPMRGRAPALAAAPAWHQVQPGDTLSALAVRYGTTVAALAAANGIRNPDLILVGQNMAVPGAAGSAPAAAGGPESQAAGDAVAGGAAPVAPGATLDGPEGIRIHLFGAPAPRRPVSLLPLLRAERAVAAMAPAGAAAGAGTAAAGAAAPADPAPDGGAPSGPETAGLYSGPGAVTVAVPQPAGRRRVALTFNGVPEPALLPDLLRALTRAGARATFFMTGAAAAADPDLGARLQGLGHEVGSLGYRPGDMAQLTFRGAQAELLQAEAAFRGALGTPPRFFRPPDGRLSPELVQAARDLGLEVVLWSAVNLRDRADHPAPVLAAQAARAAFPGAILMLHPDRPATVAALPSILAAVRARGYDLVTLGELYAP